MRRSHLFVLTLIAAAVATGISFAGAADLSQGVQVVTACVHNGNSQVRLVTDPSGCGSADTLSWNATFGSAITAHQMGDVVTSAGGLTDIDPGTSARLLSVTLVPGSYLLSAKVLLVSHHLLKSGEPPYDIDAFCVLSTSSTADQDFTPANDLDMSFNTLSGARENVSTPGTTVPLEAVATVSRTTSVHLACRDDLFNPNIGMIASHAVLAALVVGNVTP